eukprot:TRINITY_DN3429_c0_g1_i3.p1 TRINITY_DN3429_c0_g1~~TRINITY_DN3429_c0_g1_i3.p1  ORF type:complete len:743 (+),score=200.86 TRINITY_DN3429_c0_g1_i3:51-2279(+)
MSHFSQRSQSSQRNQQNQPQQQQQQDQQQQQSALPRIQHSEDYGAVLACCWDSMMDSKPPLGVFVFFEKGIAWYTYANFIHLSDVKPPEYRPRFRHRTLVRPIPTLYIRRDCFLRVETAKRRPCMMRLEYRRDPEFQEKVRAFLDTHNAAKKAYAESQQVAQLKKAAKGPPKANATLQAKAMLAQKLRGEIEGKAAPGKISADAGSGVKSEVDEIGKLKEEIMGVAAAAVAGEDEDAAAGVADVVDPSLALDAMDEEEMETNQRKEFGFVLAEVCQYAVSIMNEYRKDGPIVIPPMPISQDQDAQQGSALAKVGLRRQQIQRSEQTTPVDDRTGAGAGAVSKQERHEIPTAKTEKEVKNLLFRTMPEMKTLFENLVQKRVISEDEFWRIHKVDLEVARMQFLKTVQPNPNEIDLAKPQQSEKKATKSYHLTPENKLRIFADHPKIEREYKAKVPGKLTEEKFWEEKMAPHDQDSLRLKAYLTDVDQQGSMLKRKLDQLMVRSDITQDLTDEGYGVFLPKEKYGGEQAFDTIRKRLEEHTANILEPVIAKKQEGPGMRGEYTQQLIQNPELSSQQIIPDNPFPISKPTDYFKAVTSPKPRSEVEDPLQLIDVAGDIFASYTPRNPAIDPNASQILQYLGKKSADQHHKAARFGKDESLEGPEVEEMKFLYRKANQILQKLWATKKKDVLELRRYIDQLDEIKDHMQKFRSDLANSPMQARLGSVIGSLFEPLLIAFQEFDQSS